jgi:hypothetical protein
MAVIGNHVLPKLNISTLGGAGTSQPPGPTYIEQAQQQQPQQQPTNTGPYNPFTRGPA